MRAGIAVLLVKFPEGQDPTQDSGKHSVTPTKLGESQLSLGIWLNVLKDAETQSN